MIKNKGGRPKKDKKRSLMIGIRTTEEEKNKFNEMANYYGKTTPELIRELLEKKHKEYVSESFFSTYGLDDD